MDAIILASAKKDLPLYFNDFKAFWDKSLTEYTNKDLTDCYHSTLIPLNWEQSLVAINSKDILPFVKEIFQDVNSSFFFATFGLYRSAYMHLRSSIELLLQAMYFHDHPVELKKWHKGEFVIKHDKLTDYFVTHPDFGNTYMKNLIEMITRDWKHFSKHIHGESPEFFQTDKETVRLSKFSKQDFGIWKSNHIKTLNNLNRLFLISYKNYLIKFPSTNRNILIRNLTLTDKKNLGIEK